MSQTIQLEESKIYQAYLERLSTIERMPDKPEETPKSTLHALWLLVQNEPHPVSRALQHKLRSLSDSEQTRLSALLDRRESGEPTAHIIGLQEFMGITMLAGPGAMIPRKETEILGALALKTLEQIGQNTDRPIVIDVCTGSGALALAVASNNKTAAVFGSDISQEAIDAAKKNAAYLGLDNRVQFQVGDLLSPFDNTDYLSKTHMIICNPPYISAAGVNKLPQEISQYEPRQAFDGGPFGIAVLSRLISEAPRFLEPGGALCFEVGLGQGPGMIRRATSTQSYSEIRSAEDKEGNIRVICAVRK